MSAKEEFRNTQLFCSPSAKKTKARLALLFAYVHLDGDFCSELQRSAESCDTPCLLTGSMSWCCAGVVHKQKLEEVRGLKSNQFSL